MSKKKKHNSQPLDKTVETEDKKLATNNTTLSDSTHKKITQSETKEPSSAENAATASEPVTEQDVEELIEKTAYPDINKANTKTIVIWSLVVVILVFLLSVLFPSPSTTETGTTKPTSSTETATEATSSSTEDIDTKDTNIDSTTEDILEDNEPELFDMGQVETSVTMEVFSMPEYPKAKPGFQEINGNTYYLAEGESPFTGWLNINNICYYILETGVIATGWQTIDNVSYYFDQNGRMQTNQWIDDKYVGTNGNMYVNAITPDGIYVGRDGLEDTSLGKQGSTEGLYDLRATLEDMLSGYSGTWSVYVKDIENKEYLSINNRQYFSASLIKLYCAAAAFDLIEKGAMEETERINSLMYQMISISDNDAFSLMVSACSGTNSQVAGRPVIQKYIDSEGYTDTTLTSMLLPTKYKAPSSPGRNYTTVDDCGLLLEKIYKGKCVSPESSRKFLDLLFDQTHLNKIPAGLPEGTRCANKTGDTDEFQHDAAIVYSPGGDYIITVMSENGGAAIVHTQEISKVVYDYFN